MSFEPTLFQEPKPDNIPMDKLQLMKNEYESLNTLQERQTYFNSLTEWYMRQRDILSYSQTNKTN